MVRRQSAQRSTGSSSGRSARAVIAGVGSPHVNLGDGVERDDRQGDVGLLGAVDERSAVEVPRLMVRFVGQDGERDAVGPGRGGDGDDGVGELLEESGEELQAHGGFVGGDAKVVEVIGMLTSGLLVVSVVGWR
jgi:hypothetical protein